jgi:hypothetical protein
LRIFASVFIREIGGEMKKEEREKERRAMK